MDSRPFSLLRSALNLSKHGESIEPTLDLRNRSGFKRFPPCFCRISHAATALCTPARGVASLRCASVHHDDGSRGISWLVLDGFGVYEADSWCT